MAGSPALNELQARAQAAGFDPNARPNSDYLQGAQQAAAMPNPYMGYMGGANVMPMLEALNRIRMQSIGNVQGGTGGAGGPMPSNLEARRRAVSSPASKKTAAAKPKSKASGMSFGQFSDMYDKSGGLAGLTRPDWFTEGLARNPEWAYMVDQGG